MTGFGRSSKATPIGHFIAEVQSLNRKYLETFTVLPKELSRFEIPIKKWVAQKMHRGQVTVRIYSLPTEENLLGWVPDVKLLSVLKKGWEKTAEQVGLSHESISLEFLARELRYTTGIESFGEVQEYEPILFSLMDEAVGELDKMRQIEGKTLEADIMERFKLIENNLNQIEAKAPVAPAKFRERLQKVAEEFLHPNPENEQRILREIVVIGDKLDITEEIVRFRSHLDQFRKLTKSDLPFVGRKLDFLLQEMGREANTISAKASDAQVSSWVVDTKSELEKIREQVQNIE